MAVETVPEGRAAPDASISVAAGHCLAWIAAAGINAVTIASRPMPRGGTGIRLAHHFYDAGQLLAVGLLSWATVVAWSRARRRWTALQRSHASVAALALLSSVIGYAVLRPELRGASERIGFALGYASDAEPEPQQTILYLVLSLTVPIAWLVGTRLARPRWRWAVAAASLGTLVLNERIIDGAYPGVHAYIAWSTATLLGTSLAGSALTGVPPMWRTRARKLRYGALALATAAAGWSVGVWPSSAVLVEMFQIDGAVVVPNLALVRSALRRSPSMSRVSKADGEWIAPSGTNLMPDNPIVLLITIDSVRNDIVTHKTHRRGFPNLVRLQKEGVDFRVARASSSGTRYSIAGLFAGRYWSQLPWTNPESYRPVIKKDESARFTDVLVEGGVQTVTFVADYRGLVNENGIVRSFQEETILKPDGTQKFDFVDSSEMLDHAIPRLLEQGDTPLFMYMHWMDPHTPYDLGGKKGSTKRRYINEIAFADKQLGRLRKELEKAGLWDRTVLIISADHGEGLGQHNCKFHNRNLYEELIRVPMVIRVPGVRPRRVDTPVSQLDLGPTILDLMGLPTPPEFVGESLAPYLRGETPQHKRPIAAEHKQMIAWVTADNFKVIINEKTQAEEIYDLDEDPDETNNLRDELGDRGDQLIDELRAYFHELAPDAW